MNAAAYAQSQLTCAECAGQIVAGMPIVKTGYQTFLHRGCASAPLVRRPAHIKQPFPAWAILLIALTAAFGLFVSTQIVALRLIDTFGTIQARDLGVPMLGPVHEPLRSAVAGIRISWSCYGMHKPESNGSPRLRGSSGFIWGGGCTPEATKALRERVLLPALSTLALAIAGMIVLRIFGGLARQKADNSLGVGRVPKLPDRDSGVFHLFLGRATGRFAQYGHGSGIVRTSPVVLTGDDAAQNIVIFGGTGSGKTVFCLNRLLKQALEQDCGILIFDVKGDYGKTVRALANEVGRLIIRIGVGGRRCNLLAGLTPETAASFIKSAILLAGNTGSASAFWTNTATELVTATLGLLQYFPERYSLKGLYEAIYIDHHRSKLNRDISRKQKELEIEKAAGGERALEATDELIRIASYCQYIQHDFMKFDEKVQSGAHSQLSQVIRIFSLPEIDDAFCQAGDDVLSMQEVLNGGVFVLDLPLQKYGLGAKTVYTLIKLRFFNVVERRRTEPSWDQDRPINFFCDEYQELISVSKEGLSDRNFWDKSRSSRCVGIVSAQGFESFSAAVGDVTLTRALLQNFRQKIAFRSEDMTTVDFFTKILGATEVEFDSVSTSKSRGNAHNGSSTSNSTSRSNSVREQSVINAQMFRRLDRGEAICILSIDGAAYDDVLTMPPLFVNTKDSTPPVPRASTLARMLQAVRFNTTAQSEPGPLQEGPVLNQ